MNRTILRSLQSADLNSLVTLSVLLESRSTTMTADRLAKTQSAVSHTLKKLRETFDDPLLIRDGKSLELTARARAIQPVLRKTLSEINALITEPDGFAPEYSQREFRIAAPNFYAGAITQLSRRLRNYSDDLSIQIDEPDAESINKLLENQLDLVIAPSMTQVPAKVGREKYNVVEWCVYASKNNSVSNRSIKKKWSVCPHVQVVTGHNVRSPVNDLLESKGIQRNIALRVPDFLSALMAVCVDDTLLFTAPKHPLGKLAAKLDLKVLTCPVDLPSIPLFIYTSKIRSRPQDVEWIREQLISLH